MKRDRTHYHIVLSLTLTLMTIFLASCASRIATSTSVQAPEVTSPAARGNWPSYMLGNARTGFNQAETTITPLTAPQLKLHWIDPGDSRVFSQPVVANGLIYWGSGDGYEHATNLHGHEVWKDFLGWSSSTCPGNGDDKNGVLDTATVTSMMIHGQSTQVVFVGGGNARFYALNAATGATIWSTLLGNPPNTFLWSSPATYNGRIYEGVSSLSGCPQVQGKFVQMDASTGKVLHTFDTVPDGCTGGSVWGSPTLDIANNALYFGTGNWWPGCPTAERYAVALVKLRLSDLALLDSWQIPQPEQIPDSDFGTTPTLFDATIGGVRRQMVSLVNKNGVYYAFDRATIERGPVWSVELSKRYTISPSVWDGNHLYVGSKATDYQGQSCSRALSALNPATGAYIWRHCMPDGAVVGAITAIPGVVIASEGNAFLVLSTVDGHTLFSYTHANASFVGPASISNGVLYIGSYTGGLYAFGL
jgi:polyvinyl alcohol dehydrogenase (cytochrome)